MNEDERETFKQMCRDVGICEHGIDLFEPCEICGRSFCAHGISFFNHCDDCGIDD
jgi:hypothetical protein